MKKNIFISILLLALCGCDSDGSTMGKLKSDKQHPELTKMWRVERQNKSELWKSAITYCNADAGSFISYNKKPNCKAVINEYLSSEIKGARLDAHPLDSKF